MQLFTLRRHLRALILHSLKPSSFEAGSGNYSNNKAILLLLNSQPWIMHFAYSDWFTQSWLSAHIPWFDLIW